MSLFSLLWHLALAFFFYSNSSVFYWCCALSAVCKRGSFKWYIVIPEHFNPHSGTPQTFWVTRPDSSLKDLAVEESIDLCQRLCKPKLFEAEMEQRKQLLSTVSETLWDSRECNSRIPEKKTWAHGFAHPAWRTLPLWSEEVDPQIAFLSYLLTLILL